ncbi:DUF5994 family protein [Nocardia vermiculata]|uniref:Uncharacterized protein n=1 Tax=Nocardia vermiculata TaxID=257274 RepID=A0A846XTZ3_9NOCA|nr:DUF5994 family protein [Nocardia vermiculata]NKY48871.1 hypothetical protein [Nocardia vermiculata]
MTRHTERTRTESSGDMAVRLRLKPDSEKTGYVDGAWWPRENDLAVELPALLEIAEGRLGSVRRVTYRLGEWASAPGEVVIDGRSIRLEGHPGGTVNTIELLNAGDRRLVLLVVPPYTDASEAFAALTSASTDSDTSTVDELLMISPEERGARTDRAAAEHRWNSERGSLLDHASHGDTR